jgi:hypothetical protein
MALVLFTVATLVMVPLLSCFVILWFRVVDELFIIAGLLMSLKRKINTLYLHRKPLASKTD